MSIKALAAKYLYNIDFLDEIVFETSEVFDYNFSRMEAYQLIEDLNNIHALDINYESNKWHFYNNISGCTETMDFNFLDSLTFVKHLDIENVKTALKCWVLHRIVKDNLRATSVETYFNHVKEALLVTNAFAKNSVEDYSIFLASLALQDSPKRQKVISVLNFLSFYEEIDKEHLYSDKLGRVLRNLKKQNKSRLIPSGLDILKFSKMLEDYFENVDTKSKEYIHFFPILLWWRITTVIPLRPFEFCAIETDCMLYENEKCYLKLPRLKGRKNKNRKQIIDKILIPRHIEELLNEYSHVIARFNHKSRKTFLSRLAYEKTLKNSMNIMCRKRSNDYFLTPDLQSLIERFYSEIIQGYYGFSYSNLAPVGRKSTQVVYECNSDLIRVRAIDSRHIAFINMLAQGWSKPEIARFGGHLILETQANYQNHEEYWIEEETQKLLKTFRLGIKTNTNISSDVIQYNCETHTLSNRLDAAFKHKFVLRPTTSSVTNKLKLGYCTDPLQACKSHCSHCNYWRISAEEFREKNNEIQQFINECDNQIHDLFAFLKDTHRFVHKGELNTQIADNVLSTQKKLNDQLLKRSTFLFNLEKSTVDENG
ncbi:hypothetical protein [Paenibacillus sp. GCM10012306]|uniref:hypothetical protein n=1 Tax=Paenibacillus sp. GCM10012306 TaxID=3317342 RepID=UPI003618C11D